MSRKSKPKCATKNPTFFQTSDFLRLASDNLVLDILYGKCHRFGLASTRMEAQKEEKRAYTFVITICLILNCLFQILLLEVFLFFFFIRKSVNTIAASMHWCFLIDFINGCCLDAVNMIGF